MNEMVVTEFRRQRSLERRNDEKRLDREALKSTICKGTFGYLGKKG